MDLRMTLSETLVNGRRETPCVPDVNGLSPLDAALAYADAGWYVLPVAVGKHPGSIVHTDWPLLSSRDLDVLESYWDRHPDAGIALHMGKSGATGFDLDMDRLPAELVWAASGAVQYTRRRGGRAHYVFASDEIFVSHAWKLRDGTVVGDIKSGNSVIMAQPSPHPNPDGEYHWRAGDIGKPLPPLPDEARAYLTLLTAKARWCGGNDGVYGIEASDELVAQALSEWIGDERMKALDGPVNSIREARSATRDTARDALRFIASEARIGFYPLETVVKEARSAMIESYNERGEPEKYSDYEFGRLVANGVGYALSRSPQEIRDEADRDFPGKFSGFKPAFKPTFQPVFQPIFYGNVR